MRKEKYELLQTFTFTIFQRNIIFFKEEPGKLVLVPFNARRTTKAFFESFQTLPCNIQIVKWFL